MRILITNDDGIEAPGLDVLQAIASELSDDVWVVAPETDQSGAAHSLTLHEPLRLRKLGERTYAVKGTPTDCVIMGVRHILHDQGPDLVLSGINSGHNIADDVTYSGTIAGAIEGTLLGIPSVALSLAADYEKRGELRWQTPMAHGAALIGRLIKIGWPEDVVMNINFPDCEPDEVRASRSPTRASATRIICASSTAPMGAANPITGSASTASSPSRRKGPISGRCGSGIFRSRRCYLDLTHTETCRKLKEALGS